MKRHHHAGFRFAALALIVTLVVLSLLPPTPRLHLLALILALTAGIYLGFAWLDARRRIVILEGIAALVLLAVALAGTLFSPLLLAAGFLAHIGWDLLHHPRGLTTRIAPWVPPACLLYDLGVAIAIVVWWWPL